MMDLPKKCCLCLQSDVVLKPIRKIKRICASLMNVIEIIIGESVLLELERFLSICKECTKQIDRIYLFFEKTSRNSKKLATYLEQLRLMSDFEDGARIKDGQGPEVEKSEAEDVKLAKSENDEDSNDNKDETEACREENDIDTYEDYLKTLHLNDGQENAVTTDEDSKMSNFDKIESDNEDAATCDSDEDVEMKIDINDDFENAYGHESYDTREFLDEPTQKSNVGKTCKKSFPSLRKLKTRKLRHARKSYEDFYRHKLFRLRKNPQLSKLRKPGSNRCKFCRKAFRCKNLLLRHVTTRHREKLRRCKACLDYFATEFKFKCHSSLHTGRVPCFIKNLQKKRKNCDNSKKPSRAYLRNRNTKCEKQSETEPNTKNKPHNYNTRGKASVGKTDSKYDENSHECMTCGKIFKCKGSLTSHTSMHARRKKSKRSSEKPFACKVCSKTFEQKSILTIHMLTHPAEKPHKCATCGKGYSKKSYLSIHQMKHTGEKPHKCDKCGKRFVQKSILATHQRTHIGEKPHKCETCGKCFALKGYLSNHQAIHTGEKSHKCTTCGKRFTRKSSLVNHQKIHTGEKQHRCDHCEKSFYQKAGLASHMLTHTGHKPHKCQKCEKSFSQKGNLATHTAKHHGKKHHECKSCGMSFRCKSSLNKHNLTHLAEQSLTCDICDVSFDEEDIFTDHMSFHVIEKPFSCDICGRSFAQRFNLHIHNLTHTYDKPRKREACV